jgi:hypothetical protein
MERILSQKWERAFVFFKHEEEAKGAEMAVGFHKLADSIKERPRPGGSQRNNK